jgi:hypothetical protein
MTAEPDTQPDTTQLLLKRDWMRARAWLYRTMQPAAGSQS